MLLCRGGWGEIERRFVENESHGKKLTCGQGVGVGAEKRCGKNGLVVWPFFWRDLRCSEKFEKQLSKKSKYFLMIVLFLRLYVCKKSVAICNSFK